MITSLGSSQASFATSPQGRIVAPGGLADWILLAGAVLLVLWAFVLCVRRFLRPEESEPTHVKRRIIQDRITNH